MSPEQILARGIDRRSDIFSLGVVLWELVTGCRLFARESDAATLYAIMNDPIPKAAPASAERARDLENIISTALARTPADRYETCEEMQAALDRFLTTQPKFDSRALAGTLEGLFGSTRAEAKRSIAATRALSKNVSLVMKLRTEVRDGLAKQLTVRQHSEPIARTPQGGRHPRRRGCPCHARWALGYLLLRNPEPAKPSVETQQKALASIKIDSRPSGAAIFVRGEPTGLVTPATLTGLSPGEVDDPRRVAGPYTRIAPVQPQGRRGSDPPVRAWLRGQRRRPDRARRPGRVARWGGHHRGRQRARGRRGHLAAVRTPRRQDHDRGQDARAAGAGDGLGAPDLAAPGRAIGPQVSSKVTLVDQLRPVGGNPAPGRSC